MIQKKTTLKAQKNTTRKRREARRGKADRPADRVRRVPHPGTVSTPAPGGRMTPPTRGVKVRMYRTGLGDCFLLAFPRSNPADGARDAFYLLIDCGVYKGTPEPDNATRIHQIVQNIRDSTGGKLDLLVITHEHWDHVSAFHPSQAQAIFDREIELGTLWMAWTENLNIQLARDLYNGRRAARAALMHALTRMQGLTAARETSDLIRKVLDFFGDPVDVAKEGGVPRSSDSRAAAGASAFEARSVQTEEAMTWIKETYGKGKTKFLHPGDGPLALDGVPEARVYILGPPEDATLIKRYNPSASSSEVYPKAMAAAVEAAFFAAFGVVRARLDDPPDEDAVKEACLPFDENHRIKIADARKDRFFKEHYYTPREPSEWRRIEGNWLDAASEFALQLDSATNNTSLAFALEIGPIGEGKVLLFPGDAQVGNWQSWFGKVRVGKQLLGKDMLWGAAGKKVTAEDLLRRTVLYKVGHHGSHNGTLRAQGLELMGHRDGSGDLVALLPVDEHVARDLAHYGEMPLRSLVKELAIRTNGHVARSDEGAEPRDSQSTLMPIPGAPMLQSDFVDARTNLYFEYTVAPPS